MSSILTSDDLPLFLDFAYNALTGLYSAIGGNKDVPKRWFREQFNLQSIAAKQLMLVQFAIFTNIDQLANQTIQVNINNQWYPIVDALSSLRWT